MPLKIKAWQRVFENNRTRELDAPRYVCWPTKQDSEGFCELARTAEGTVALGVFGVLVQWASRAPVRGVLADERGEMNAERYAKRYGLPVADAQVAFATLVAVGWLETDDELPTDCRSGADVVPIDCRPPADVVPKDRSRRGQEGRGQEQEQDASGGAAPDAASLDEWAKSKAKRPDWLPDGKPWITAATWLKLAADRPTLTADELAAILREAREGRHTLMNPAAFVIARIKASRRNP